MEPVFRGIRVTQSLLFCVDYCLFIGHFSFGHCIVCLLQFTISDYISGIFKLLFLTCNKTIECLKIPKYLPTLGNIIIYSILHCGQATLAVLFPFCFSSIHRCKQYWWTHFVVPLHIQGWTQPASVSSSSVAKHTQQAFLYKKKLQNITWNKL